MKKINDEDLLQTLQQLVFVTGDLSLLQRKNAELTAQLKEANEDAEWFSNALRSFRDELISTAPARKGRND